MSSSASALPKEIYDAAKHGELQQVVKWLRKGGHVDALFFYDGCFGEDSFKPCCTWPRPTATIFWPMRC